MVAQRFPRPSLKDLYPCVNERSTVSSVEHHYTYHLAWAARIIARTKPEFHVDISSSLYFSTIISAFIPVRFYDYRPAALALDDFQSYFADLTSLPFDNGSLNSLSCMHVVEHVGLGRYGDAIDPEGDLRAMMELKRVVAPGGSLLFVVPVGQPRIEFNAHRIYSYHHIAEAFADLELVEFSLIPDYRDGTELIRHAHPELVDKQEYGCGCFLFKKPPRLAPH